jgi:hypothetical protein
MRGMRRLLLTAVLALASCGPSASQGRSPNRAAGGGSDSDLVCHEETPTGSSFSREVCRTPEQIEADRKSAEDLMRTRGTQRRPQ